MNNFYYNFDKLFSYNFLIAFVIGERGVGKSFNSKVHAIKKFLKTGEQFIYMRRYKTELDTAMTTFWGDLQANNYFDDLKLEVKKGKTITTLLCDDKICGYAIPLSTSNILKSTPFPNVTTLIFDEFLLDTGGTHRYLKHEVTMFLDVIESVGRLRDNLKVVLLGNALNVHASPYFAYWDLDLPEGDNEFRTFKDGAIVVNYIRNLKYREAKKASRFGKLIDGTDYGKFAIENQILHENNSFISKRPSVSKIECLFIINGITFGVWNGRDGYLYISDKFDPNCRFKFAFDFTDHTESTVFETVRKNLWLQVVLRAYKLAFLKFESQKIKSIVVQLLNRCLSVT